jgi:hypothetical protein
MLSFYWFNFNKYFLLAIPVLQMSSHLCDYQHDYFEAAQDFVVCWAVGLDSTVSHWSTDVCNSEWY